MHSQTLVLFEHATGYSLFRLNEFEEIGNFLPQVQDSIRDASKFSLLVQFFAFSPFRNAADALENCKALSEGVLHSDLLNFLEENVPKLKKTTITLGVCDAKLATAITEQLPYITCISSEAILEVQRGIRQHYDKLLKNITHHKEKAAQIGLSHSFSRGKVKFNVSRADGMIVQAIALLDQMDKDINLLSMRAREWYSYHFPELFQLVPDHLTFCRCANFIRDRNTLTDDKLQGLTEIVSDEAKAQDIVVAARSSMGADITPIDLINLERFTGRVVRMIEYRKIVQLYLKDRMEGCAPNLLAITGEQVGAHLISQAGSLSNLAKIPASTIQILGAEKALFRALKTRGNTPKYGILFHSSFIGRATLKNKGRISRYVSNKCALASRIDCFSEVLVGTYGQYLRQQIEDRLKFFETGEVPKKNLEVMKEAAAEAQTLQAKVLKKMRKRLLKEEMMRLKCLEDMKLEQAKKLKENKKKKQKRVKAEEDKSEISQESELFEPTTEQPETEVKTTKKKKSKEVNGEMTESVKEPLVEVTPKKKKKAKTVDGELTAHVPEPQVEAEPQPTEENSKRKKRKHDAITVDKTVDNADAVNVSTVLEVGLSAKKKRRKKHKAGVNSFNVDDDLAAAE